MCGSDASSGATVLPANNAWQEVPIFEHVSLASFLFVFFLSVQGIPEHEKMNSYTGNSR
jgi:hypothetical protein